MQFYPLTNFKSFITTGNEQLDSIITYTLLSTLTSQLSIIVAQTFSTIWIIVTFIGTFLYPIISKQIKKIGLFFGYQNKLSEIIIEKIIDDNTNYYNQNSKAETNDEIIKKIKNNKVYYALNYYLYKNKFSGLQSTKITVLNEETIYVASDNYNRLIKEDPSKKDDNKGKDNNIYFNGFASTNIVANISDNYFGDEIINNVYLKIMEIPVDRKNMIIYSIRSYVYSISYLIKMLDQIIKEYDEYLEKKEEATLYHHIYIGNSIFSTFIFKDKNNPNNQTFEHLFYDSKEEIISRIKKLDDIKWYFDRGLKRKLALIFAGSAGSGKTNTISAIANMTNRHIIEIPMCKVKTNSEFLNIMNIKNINQKDIRKNNSILVFDEIDSMDATNVTKNEANLYDNLLKEMTDIKKVVTDDREKIIELEHKLLNFDNNNKNNNDNNKNNISKREGEDKLNMRFILSQLDGLSNQDGMIIIATTNNIQSLDTSLCRDQRLEIIKFENMNKRNLKEFIKKYYNQNIDEKNLPNITIPSATIKKIFSVYADNLEKFLEEIRKY